MWSIFSRDPSKDFAYEINDLVIDDSKWSSFWCLHNGKKKATGEQVSIFRYELKSNTNDESFYMELAKNSLKRIKTLRHPSILTYLDSLETDKYILIVTEFIEPLQLFLQRMSTSSSNNCTEKQLQLAKSWGLLSIAKGLCFLNNDCKLIHGNLSINSIFINSYSDWKIFNLEYLTNIGDYSPKKLFYPHKIYTAPEIQEFTSKTDKSIDSWGLGCLIWEIFNEKLLQQHEDLKSVTKKIPKNLLPLYSSLIKSPPSQRLSIQNFIEKGKNSGYFNNFFIDTLLFLEEIHLKDQIEKNRFFSNLNNQFNSDLLESFPDYYRKNKILPFVIKTLEFGEANCHCLDLLIKIGKSLDKQEYQIKLIPIIIKLFASKDRSIRSKLLKELEEYIDFIPVQAINEQILPYLLQGFLDSNPVIREQTVKSIFHLAPKLNQQNLNDEILKHFSRIQMKDPEGGIRTNTIICLGKIASNLQPQTRQNIMLPLFLRSLRDPFPPSRIACIQSLNATQNFFPLQDFCTKIMPALCLILMDPEKQVRDQAFLTLKNFLAKIEQFSENPALIEQMESEINKSGSNVSASKFTSSLSWAVNSLAAKFQRSKLENDSTTTTTTTTTASTVNNNESTSGQISSSSSSSSPNKNNRNNEMIINNNKSNQPSSSTKTLSSSNDGWDDDNWEDDLLMKDESTTITKINNSIGGSGGNGNGSGGGGWDEFENDDWNDAIDDNNFNFNNNDTPKSKNEDKPINNFSNNKSSSSNQSQLATKPTTSMMTTTQSKPKKGPMKLGAQKLKKNLEID